MSKILDFPFRRGYAGIGLINPKDINNVGAALRAAWVFKAALIAHTGERYKPSATDTYKAVKHIPLIRANDIFDIIPYDCTPIAVDLLPDAIPLPIFKHPDRAFYIFGPEDGTLSGKITSRCKYSLVIPSRGCLNLAAAVNVILYDRESKRYNKRLDHDIAESSLAQMG